MKGGECMPKPDQRYPSKLLRSIFRAAFLTSVFMEFTQISALLIDGIITAKYLGTDAIAAVGLSSPFFYFVGIIGTSFAIGLQTVCTKEIGRGDTDRANAIIYETMIFVLILSVAFSIAIAINIPRGVYLLGARGDALNLKTPAEQYLYGLVLEIVPYILVSIFIPVVILDNGSKTVMIASFLGTVTDIVFDILAVSMKKGIYGIGFATSVSTIVSLAVLFTHFLKKERMLAFHPVPIRFRDIKEIVILSLPKAVHQLAGVIRPIFLNLLVVSVGGSLALLGGTAVADLGADGEEGRMLLVCLCLLNGLANSRQIVAVLHGDGLEPESLHALLHILGKGKIRTALNGDIVAVVKNDELGKSQCPRQRECLGGNALHHAAVAA